MRGHIPDVSFGEVGQQPKPESDVDEDEDKEESEPTPPDVVEILGFDPDKESELDDEGGA